MGSCNSTSSIEDKKDDPITQRNGNRTRYVLVTGMPGSGSSTVFRQLHLAASVPLADDESCFQIMEPHRCNMHQVPSRKFWSNQQVKKYWESFLNVDAIIFVVDLSCYNKKTELARPNQGQNPFAN
jgi:hypothetical protein